MKNTNRYSIQYHKHISTSRKKVIVTSKLRIVTSCGFSVAVAPLSSYQADAFEEKNVIFLSNDILEAVPGMAFLEGGSQANTSYYRSLTQPRGESSR